VVRPHLLQIDPRRVGEEHEDQRDFRETVNKRIADMRIGDSQDGLPDQ
jgi:hypothetical protein